MAPEKVMLIDALPPITPHPEKIEVLAMGFSRTGTMSLRGSLETLGIKPYHSLDAYRAKTFPYLLEALKAKYRGEGRPYGKAEFDKLFGHYNAVIDLPCIMFVDELLAAYPDAKVILTQRDADSWLVSMNKTILEILSWKSFYFIAPYDTVSVGPWLKFLRYVVEIWTNGNINDRQKLVQTFHDHYEHVRAVVPKEKILEFKPGDGYESLCKFLDKPPLPKDETYPHINRPDNLIEIHRKLYRSAFAIAVKKVGVKLGFLAIATGATWYSLYQM